MSAKQSLLDARAAVDTAAFHLEDIPQCALEFERLHDILDSLDEKIEVPKRCQCGATRKANCECRGDKMRDDAITGQA